MKATYVIVRYVYFKTCQDVFYTRYSITILKKWICEKSGKSLSLQSNQTKIKILKLHTRFY